MAHASHPVAAISAMLGTVRMRSSVGLMTVAYETSWAGAILGIEAVPKGTAVAFRHPCYGRNPSKIIWSAKRAAHRRSASVRTVQVNTGIPAQRRATSGTVAGRSTTA